MPLRPATLALQGAVLAALVGGTTAFVTLDKTVTVSVDGKEQEVRSFARTVGGVLDAEGIDVGSHDVIAPGLDSPLRDGQRVSVRYGRQLTLEVDGKRTTAWVTAQTVDEALDQLDVPADGALLSASRSRAIGREGIALKVRTRKNVTVAADGKERAIATTSLTVGGALRAAKVTLGANDRVVTNHSGVLRTGQRIRVTRVDYRTKAHVYDVAFQTVRKQTDDLYDGQTRVADAGDTGARRLVYRLTYVDGKRTATKLLSQKLIERPETRVILVGTAERPVVQRASRSSGRSVAPRSDGLNWAALADCESGGNPRAVNPAGYYGLYQFSLSTWASVGGSGNPIDASPGEQTLRAQILYSRTGPSSWPVCGARL